MKHILFSSNERPSQQEIKETLGWCADPTPSDIVSAVMALCDVVTNLELKTNAIASHIVPPICPTCGYLRISYQSTSGNGCEWCARWKGELISALDVIIARGVMLGYDDPGYRERYEILTGKDWTPD